MKLSDCKLGEVIEIINREGEEWYYKDDRCKDQHFIGHIIGFDCNGIEVIPLIRLASGKERAIHHSNIRVYRG